MARRIRAASRTTPDADDRVLDVTVVLLDGGYASTAIAPLECFPPALANWLRGEPRGRVSGARRLDRRACGDACVRSVSPACAIHDIGDRHHHPAGPRLGRAGRDRARHALLPWLRKWHAAAHHIAGVRRRRVPGGIRAARRPARDHALGRVGSRARHPKVLWQPDQFVTEDGRCQQRRGSRRSTPVFILEKFCGHEIALQCAKSMLLSMPRGRQSGYAVVPLSRPHSDDKIRHTEEYLRENFDRDVSIDVLAARVAMGPRNFIRRFKAATGRVPGAYLQALRISAAREMFEHGAVSVQAVSQKIGYQDVAFFRSLFRRHTGMAPAEYRTRFARMNFERGALVDGRSVA